MSIPFLTVHMDHLGPFGIFVIVDGFTKFCFIEAVRDAITRLVINVLLNMMLYLGPLLSMIQENLHRGNLKEIRECISEKLTTEQRKQKERFGKTRINSKKYTEGMVGCLD